jgi:hypothetical protein
MLIDGPIVAPSSGVGADTLGCGGAGLVVFVAWSSSGFFHIVVVPYDKYQP